MKHWGQGYDGTTGNGADIALQYLYNNQPPYIFGSSKQVSIGDTFMIKDYRFQVIRICTSQEYLDSMGHSWYVDRCVCFFEVATD